MEPAYSDSGENTDGARAALEDVADWLEYCGVNDYNHATVHYQEEVLARLKDAQ